MNSTDEQISSSQPRWRLLAKVEPASQPALVKSFPKILSVFQLPPAQLESAQEAIARALTGGQEGCLRVWVASEVLIETQPQPPGNRWGFFLTTRHDPATDSAGRLIVDFFLYQESRPGKGPLSPASSSFPPPGARDPPAG